MLAKKIMNFVLVVMTVLTFSNAGLAIAEGFNSGVRLAETTNQTQTETTNSNFKERAWTKFSKERSERIEKACDTAKTKLDDVSSNVDDAKTKRVNLYNNLVRVLNQFADKLDSQGYQTEQLRSDILTLQGLGNEVGTAWSNYKTSVQNVAGSDCKSDTETFHNDLETARDQFAIVKDKVDAVRNFIKSNIKKDLQDIRQQIVDKAKTTTNTQDTTTNNNNSSTQSQ